MFEVQLLKTPDCCSREEVKIWVDFDDDGMNRRSRGLVNEFNRAGAGTVLTMFAGRFETGAFGFGARYRLNVSRIEEPEAKELGYKKIPKFVPQNCSTQVR